MGYKSLIFTSNTLHIQIKATGKPYDDFCMLSYTWLRNLTHPTSILTAVLQPNQASSFYNVGPHHSSLGFGNRTL